MANLPITDISINDISIAAGNTSGDSASMDDTFFRNLGAIVFTEDSTYAPSGIPTAYGSEISIGLFRNASFDSAGAALTISIDPTVVSNLLVNSSGGSCTAKFILQSDGDFTTAYAESTTGGANGESPAIGSDNWATAANHGAGFGDNYQVQVLAYGRADGTTFGVGTLSGTANLLASTSSSNNDGGGGWSNNSSHWYRLDQNFSLEVASGTINPGSANGNGNQIDIEIKEFDGTNYGTGTTLLQHRLLMFADVDATG